jgi:hypothetical protein
MTRRKSGTVPVSYENLAEKAIDRFQNKYQRNNEYNEHLNTCPKLKKSN